jgi:hypothetical protein
MNQVIKSAVFLNLLLLSLDVFARAGGGGSSGSGSGKGSAEAAVIVGILYAIYRVRRARMIYQAKKQFAIANANDPTWNLDIFKKTATDIFYKYQDAWMDKNLSSMEPFFHQSYMAKAQKVLATKLRGKKNILTDINLRSIELMSVLDIKGKNGDMFVLEMNFSMVDYTIDEKSGRFVDSTYPRGKNDSEKAWEYNARNKPSGVTEYWVFIRQDENWFLYNIHQIDSFFGNLKHASVSKLKQILAEEKAKSIDEPVDDSFFYKKVD